MAVNTDLSRFTIGNYQVNAGRFKILTWSLVNYFILNSAVPWPQAIKRKLLQAFGARVGKGLVIKMKVRVKNPWKLSIGDYCWIGESVWIDNLEDVSIGNNVCLSQAAFLLTGNHDYADSSFPYRLGRIVLEDGVWIGARSVVCPGVTCREHSVLTVNSVATKDLEARKIYAGNPAVLVRDRVIRQ